MNIQNRGCFQHVDQFLKLLKALMTIILGIFMEVGDEA